MARLRHERALISETRPVGELNVAIWNVRRSARPALREALAIAQRCDAVDAELLELESKVPALPQITTNDPSAAVLSEISGATISEDSLKRLRLALLLVLPLPPTRLYSDQPRSRGFAQNLAATFLPARELAAMRKVIGTLPVEC
jgi:hypothetical protein